jgi:peptidoglycan-associated lipoprotein
MSSLKNLSLVCCVIATLSACGTTTKQEDQAAAEKGAATDKTVTSETLPPTTPDAAAIGRTVYFDFDSDVVHSEDRGTVAAQAKLLTASRGKKVTLQGHCDERGTTEYNMALGERRAKAVRDALTAQGVSGTQIKTVSYGESHPAKEGHDESAWKYNRRVEFVD